MISLEQTMHQDVNTKAEETNKNNKMYKIEFRIDIDIDMHAAMAKKKNLRRFYKL